MIKNYIKVAIRNLSKHQTFSFINIFGLAVGMSVCMMIIMLVADQKMNDQHNPNKDRVYRINSIPLFDGNPMSRGSETATTALPLRNELLDNYTGIEKAVRIVRGFANNWLEFEPGHDVNIPISGYYADPEVFDVFAIDLLYGNKEEALQEPYSVVLSEESAEKLFEQQNPVGELLRVGKDEVYKVTGVMKKNENKSHIAVDSYASISSLEANAIKEEKESQLKNWNNIHRGWVYIMLEEGKTDEDINPLLRKIEDDHYAQAEEQKITAANFNLQHLLSITPGKLINNPIGPFMPWIIIYFTLGLAGIIILTSCFNFTNLSIARSITRAKEIGVRKVNGAGRLQIFLQFISESVITSVLALGLALILLVVLKPMILGLPFIQVMRWNLALTNEVLLTFLALAVGVGILAGMFPALVLSGLQPLNVLKNLTSTKLMSRVGLRKALLVMQFTFSLIFILTVIVIYNQLNLFLHSEQGFNPKQKIVVQRGETDYAPLKEELLKNPQITNVALSSHIPLSGVNYGNDFKKSAGDENTFLLNYFAVDEDYLKSMEIPLVAGRFFNDENGPSNKNKIVINETAVGDLGLDMPLDAIGSTILYMEDSTEKEIIGVVKDYHHEMASGKLDPLALMYSPDEYRVLQISYNGQFQDASVAVENAWATVNPGLKVEVKDFEEEMGELYRMLFGSLVRVLGFITALAVIISCLGLLGMATYTVETRRKEIALRKVLGISDGSLVYILSKGYLSVLVISIIVAVPAAYFINDLWLQNFVIHTSVNFITVLLGVAILIFLGILTISSQTIQALFVNPVENLKSE